MTSPSRLRRYCFDLETLPIPDTPGLLPARIHCGCVIDVDTGEEWTYGPNDLDALVDKIGEADVLIGHNIAQFDFGMLDQMYPGWSKPRLMYDTLLASRQIMFTTIVGRTIAMRRAAAKGIRGEEARWEAMEERFPNRLLKTPHSLEAWGYRLRIPKGSFGNKTSNFDTYTLDMLAYCLQDCRVNVAVFDFLTERPASEGWPVTPFEAINVESWYGYLLGLQERNGVRLDVTAAARLAGELNERRIIVTDELREAFPARYVPSGPRAGLFTPKASRVSKAVGPGEDGYTNYAAGCSMTKIEVQHFNPGSGQQIADRLIGVYGWEPDPETGYTDKGNIKVDEKTLSGLPFDNIGVLVEYLTVKKRLGQISDGKTAWLRKVTDAGLIHGRVKPTGARTSRASHNQPNMAQVPKIKLHPEHKVPLAGYAGRYGLECRSMFGPTRKGWVMVGADASGLQLRMLAHRLAYYDGGEFGEVLLTGDPHSDWQKISGLYFRENQKTLTYALLFGAGDTKLGYTIIDDWRHAHETGATDQPAPGPGYARELGQRARRRLLRGIPALESLLEATHGAFRRGWVRGLDGRVIGTKSQHGVLNDVLQSDEAIIMRHAKIGFDRTMRGVAPYGEGWAYLLDIHDEWQLETEPELAEVAGSAMVSAIRWAGEKFELRLPLDGEWKQGRTWADTH